MGLFEAAKDCRTLGVIAVALVVVGVWQFAGDYVLEEKESAVLSARQTYDFLLNQDRRFQDLTPVLYNATYQHADDIPAVDEPWAETLSNIVDFEQAERILKAYPSLKTAWVLIRDGGALVGVSDEFRDKYLYDETHTRIPYEKHVKFWERFLQEGTLPNATGVDWLYHCPYTDGRFVLEIFCMNKIYWSMIIAWKADYVVWPEGPFTPIQAEVINSYDLIVLTEYNQFFKPLLQFPPIQTDAHGRRSQVRLWMPTEPDTYVWSMMRQNGPPVPGSKPLPVVKSGFCPVALNNFALTSNYLSMPFWFHYDVAAWRSMFNQFETIEDRYASKTVYVHYAYEKAAEISAWFVSRGYESPARKGLEVPDYFRLIAKSKYVVLPHVGRNSGGQIVMDAAIFGIPTLSFSNKFYQRLLMPKFLWYDSLEGLYEKIDKMDKDFDLYARTVRFIDNRLKFFDSSYFESPEQVLARISEYTNDAACRFHATEEPFVPRIAVPSAGDSDSS